MAGRIRLVELFAAVLLFSAVALFGQDSPVSPGAPKPGFQGQLAAGQDTVALARRHRSHQAETIARCELAVLLVERSAQCS
jgi:hypothetical protein